MIITSPQNPTIKDIMALREAKGRRQQNLFIIDGLRAIERAQQTGFKITKIIYAGELPLTKKPGIEYVEVAARIFDKLSYGENKETLLALAEPKQYALDQLHLPKQPLIVVVESIEKPGNLGAILRTCDGAGVDALIVCDPKTDVYNPNVVRSSTGALFNIPVVLGTNEHVLDFLKRHKIASVGAFVQGKDVYTKVNFKGSVAIVLGTEDKGLSAFWQKHCAIKTRVPMKGKVDSLNVSVCAGVMMYEALRQRS